MIANDSTFANQAATNAKQAAMVAKSLDNLAMPPYRKMTPWRNLSLPTRSSQRPLLTPTLPLHNSISHILQILHQLHQGVQQTIVARHTGQPSNQTRTLPATVRHTALNLNVDTPAPPAPTNKMGTTLQPPNPIPRAAARPKKLDSGHLTVQTSRHVEHRHSL
jgi:hypothetical protein